jgi:hypothetical protein
MDRPFSVEELIASFDRNSRSTGRIDRLLRPRSASGICRACSPFLFLRCGAFSHDDPAGISALSQIGEAQFRADETIQLSRPGSIRL